MYCFIIRVKLSKGNCLVILKIMLYRPDICVNIKEGGYSYGNE